MRPIIAATSLCLTACQTTTDPSQGGFISGVGAISSGAYEQRASDLDEQVLAERARQEQLKRELQRLTSEYGSLRRQIRQEKARISATGQTVPTALEAKAHKTLAEQPATTGSSETDLEVLRRSVAAAREIITELANIQS